MFGHSSMNIIRTICIFLVYSFLLGYSNPIMAGDPDSEWIKHIVEKLDVGDYFFTVDVDGNLIVTGCFINKSVFGNKSLVSVGNYDIFIAKYNKQGDLLWLQQAGGQDFDMANVVKTDTVGNVYITGYFTGGCFFDNYIVKSKAQRNAFTAKYSKDGKFQWVKAEGAEIYGEVRSVKRKKR